MRHVHAKLAVALLVPMVACTLLTNTSDLTGGDQPPVIVDGGSDTDLTADAANEANVAETDAGSGISDASGDATLPPVCVASSTTFCDDFDGPPLSMKWTSDTRMGGTFTVDSVASVSTPNSLSMTAAAGPNRYVSLSKVVSTSAAHMHCTFALKVDAVGTQVQRLVQYEMQAPDNTRLNVSLYVGKLDSTIRIDKLAANGAYVNGFSVDVSRGSNLFPFGQWRAVELNADFDTSDGQLQFSVDGVNRGSGPLLPFANIASAQINVGLLEDNQSTAALGYRLDNVSCATK